MVLILIAGGAAILHELWLPYLLSFLDVGEAPQMADIAVVLAGGGQHRTAYAARLYNEGFVSNILISTNADSIELSQYVDALQVAHIPIEAIQYYLNATTTYDEALGIIQYLREGGFHSAIIVTDNFHTRRTAATYQQLLNNDNLLLYVTSIPKDLGTARWWEVFYMRIGVLYEYPKLVYYFLRYGINPL